MSQPTRLSQFQRPVPHKTVPDMVSQYHDAIMDGLKTNGERMKEVGGAVQQLACDFAIFRNEDWVRLLLDVGRLSGRVDGQQAKLDDHISETKSDFGHWITFAIAIAGVLGSAILAHLLHH